jgi:Protein of unknown function (DUF2510)
VLRTLLLLALVAFLVAGTLVAVRSLRAPADRPRPLTPPPALPGWYPDPEGTARQRWWDGTAWADDYRADP